jgi:3-hydroxyisobutyrate dehydrogenase
MATNAQKIGWIGIGRMGSAMAERLAKGGADLTVWNRTRAKAEPLAALGAKVAGKLVDLATCDIVFVMVSTWDDVQEVVAAPGGLLSGEHVPRLVVECSSISLEGSAELRALLAARGVQMLAAPVSGNAKVIKAGRLSFVCSGPKSAYDACVAVAEDDRAGGELRRRRRAVADRARSATTSFLGVVTQSLAEITVLAQKAGVPRHAFLDFMNQSVMGIDFLALQEPGVRQPRLQGHLHARSCSGRTSTSARCGAPLRRTDAARLDHARPRAEPDRPGHGRGGLRQADRPAGDGVGDWCSHRRTCRSTTASRRRSDERRGESRRPARVGHRRRQRHRPGRRSRAREGGLPRRRLGARQRQARRGRRRPPRRAVRRAARSPPRRSTSPMPQPVARVAAEIEARHGGVDIPRQQRRRQRPKRFWKETDSATFDSVVAINLNGATACTLAGAARGCSGAGAGR